MSIECPLEHLKKKLGDNIFFYYSQINDLIQTNGFFEYKKNEYKWEKICQLPVMFMSNLEPINWKSDLHDLDSKLSHWFEEKNDHQTVRYITPDLFLDFDSPKAKFAELKAAFLNKDINEELYKKYKNVHKDLDVKVLQSSMSPECDHVVYFFDVKGNYDYCIKQTILQRLYVNNSKHHYKTIYLPKNCDPKVEEQIIQTEAWNLLINIMNKFLSKY